MADITARLPDGTEFAFWERESVFDRTLHVNAGAANASDDNDGSEAAPFRTIGRAAALAEPGTRILIHGGVYRECVRPARGGEGPGRLISYEAFGDGPAVIRASEEVRDFKPSVGWRLKGRPGENQRSEGVRVWAHELDPDMFRGYNPFCAVNLLHDRLFIEYDKTDMTTYLNRRGCVFCDGRWRCTGSWRSATGPIGWRPTARRCTSASPGTTAPRGTASRSPCGSSASRRRFPAWPTYG